MNDYLVVAAILSFLLGMVHSTLGERMIFQPWKLEKSHSRLNKYRGIIWATWHLVTFFGFYIGLYLLQTAGVQVPGSLNIYLGIIMSIGAALVAGATKGKHPGWIVLLIIAFLVWFAN